jgi:hypothetical protein
MSAIRPATYYEWLLLIQRHHLRLGPLERAGGSLVNHALDPTNRTISIGFWDHQSGTGLLDVDAIGAPRPVVVQPAPPIPDGNPDWD